METRLITNVVPRMVVKIIVVFFFRGLGMGRLCKMASKRQVSARGRGKDPGRHFGQLFEFFAAASTRKLGTGTAFLKMLPYSVK